MLPPELYYEKVRLSILSAIDFIVIDKNKKVLLGRRLNKPAKGFFFTPGGSIIKNENFEEAIERLSKEELGKSVDINRLKFKGIYSHIYEDNFKDDKFGTHYIDLVYIYNLEENESIDKGKFSDQHSEISWLSVNDLLKNKEVHNYVKYFFMDNAPNKFKTD